MNLLAIYGLLGHGLLCGAMVSRLPLRLKSRSEPYELISRRNAQKNPTLDLLIASLRS